MIGEWMLVGAEFGVEAFSAVVVFGALAIALLGFVATLVGLFRKNEMEDDE